MEASQGRAEGLRYFVTTSPRQNEAFRKFRDRFKKKYELEPGTFASNSYDATKLLGKAFHECGKDVSCVLTKLYATTNYPGVSGVFSIGADGIAVKNFILKEVREGEFVEVN